MTKRAILGIRACFFFGVATIENATSVGEASSFQAKIWNQKSFLENDHGLLTKRPISKGGREMEKKCFLLFLMVALIGVGCAIESSGRISDKTETMKNVDSFIKKGVTTKKELIEKYGDPASSTRDSQGNEHLTFAEKAPFWETGAGGLFMGRQLHRVLEVTLKDGIVENYFVNETWQKRR